MNRIMCNQDVPESGDLWGSPNKGRGFVFICSFALPLHIFQNPRRIFKGIVISFLGHLWAKAVNTIKMFVLETGT